MKNCTRSNRTAENSLDLLDVHLQKITFYCFRKNQQKNLVLFRNGSAIELNALHCSVREFSRHKSGTSTSLYRKMVSVKGPFTPTHVALTIMLVTSIALIISVNDVYF